MLKANAILSCVFIQVEAFPITVMFGMCSIFLFVASLLQRRLLVIADTQRPSKFCLYEALLDRFHKIACCSHYYSLSYSY